MRDNDDELQKLIDEESIQNFNEKREELRKKAKESIQKIGISEGPINTNTSADLMKPWISPEDDSSGSKE
ncbi:unnamed protein product [Parnassius mnemosyne]|uniref:Uncharacterized protein n=1 Tax=Parnassius mnemosyne TaxID=213953 RepID=A0AAV1LYY0_9NEOP